MTEGFSRRDFARAGLVAGAGLTLAVSLDGCGKEAPPAPGNAPFAPDLSEAAA